MSQQRKLDLAELLRLVSILNNKSDLKPEEILQLVNIDISNLTIADLEKIKASLAGISKISPGKDPANNNENDNNSKNTK